MDSINKLTIRGYNLQVHSHSHPYHQILLPLSGTIEIQIKAETFILGLGECIVINATDTHSFRANNHARFLVLDTYDLPDNIKQVKNTQLTVDQALIAFIQFIEKQLELFLMPELETKLLDVFYQLLNVQNFTKRLDKRISKVVNLIKQDLAENYSNEYLAQVANLSTSQFKTLFKQQTGLTPQSFISNLKMEQAKGLLIHTDLPIALIAERVGYRNASAFSRKFKAHFGLTAKSFLHF